MDKTPRQVAHEIVDAFIDRLEREDYERDLEIPIAQAIEAAIAHVRPQIEAEARAAAIEDAAILCQNLEEKEILNYGRSIDGNGCANAVAALASAPPGHVCVPVEPTPQMSAAGFCVSESEHDPAGVYRAMLAARPK
jgi:hypothetical protein